MPAAMCTASRSSSRRPNSGLVDLPLRCVNVRHRRALRLQPDDACGCSSPTWPNRPCSAWRWGCRCCCGAVADAAHGRLWWLWSGCVWMAFNLLVLALYPTLIAPLFNKFTPLADAALKTRIEALLAKCGFKRAGPVRDGRLAALQPRQRLFHRLRRRQAHRVFRHPARAPRSRRNRGGAGARTGAFQAPARVKRIGRCSP